MKLSKVLKITVLSAAVLGASVSLPWAFCDSSQETYALFQCAEVAYVEPVPAPFTPADVSGVFWQIGFGATGPDQAGSGKLTGPRDSGDGTSGSGVESGNIFNGNDNGQFGLDVLDAAAVFPTIGFPTGSVCLGSNNWANAGVDGCCDNPRAPSGLTFDYGNQYYGSAPGAYQYASDDNILNPYYGTYFTGINFPGYYSIGSMMDGPTMVLLTVSGARTPNTDLDPSPWFALMAVTNMDRGNTGDTKGGFGGCPSAANPATCDIRDGFYDFGAITNGNTNIVNGQPNAVPWQQVPRPRAACLANCSGTGDRTIELSIPLVQVHHDGRKVATNNPFLDARNSANGSDATRAAGVGVVDMMVRWGGLVRYDVEAAPVVLDANGQVDFANLAWAPLTDPNGTPVGQGLVPGLDPNTGEPLQPNLVQTFQVPADTCLRAAVGFGKPPEVTDGTLTTSDTCRTGRCGDLGYRLVSGNPLNVTCIGGALVSENIADVALDRGQGVFTLSWSTTTELSVQGFDILAVGNRQERKVADVSCQECTTGIGADYEVTLSRGDLRRAGNIESFRIVMRGGDGDSAEVPVTSRGRQMGRR